MATRQTEFKEDRFYEVAKKVVDGAIGDFVSCMQNGRNFYFEGGVWREIYDTEFLAKIQDGLLDEKGNKYTTKFPVEGRKKIIDNFRIMNFKALHEFNKMNLLNFENVMFDPSGLNVMAHDKKYYSTIRIPYKYNSLAECSLWKKSILEIFEGSVDKVSLLQEFFGQCLTRDVKKEMALLLLGESKSGKSTILNTLQYMMGEENTSTVGLEYVINPVYTSQMIGKLVNIDTDVSKKAQDYEANFKRIVTGEKVKCNDKYETPFDFRPFCKMVLSANDFPKIADHSSAFYNRLIVIPCNRAFSPSERNINLREQLLEELPGIFNWAVEGLVRLEKRGNFEDLEVTHEAVEELEAENNPAYQFFNEHVEVDFSDGIYVTKQELYNKYKSWSQQSGAYPLSEVIFGKCIFKKFHKTTPKDSRLAHSGRPRIWRSLKYVETKTSAGVDIPQIVRASEGQPAEVALDWGDENEKVADVCVNEEKGSETVG